MLPAHHKHTYAGGAGLGDVAETSPPAPCPSASHLPYADCPARKQQPLLHTPCCSSTIQAQGLCYIRPRNSCPPARPARGQCPASVRTWRRGRRSSASARAVPVRPASLLPMLFTCTPRGEQGDAVLKRRRGRRGWRQVGDGQHPTAQHYRIPAAAAPCCSAGAASRPCCCCSALGGGCTALKEPAGDTCTPASGGRAAARRRARATSSFFTRPAASDHASRAAQGGGQHCPPPHGPCAAGLSQGLAG